MNGVSVIPKGRDANAAALYIFMRWYLRCNRYDIERKLKREMSNLMIYGTTHPEIDKIPKGLLQQ